MAVKRKRKTKKAFRGESDFKGMGRITPAEEKKEERFPKYHYGPEGEADPKPDENPVKEEELSSHF